MEKKSNKKGSREKKYEIKGKSRREEWGCRDGGKET